MKRKFSTAQMAFIGVMAALSFVSNYIRIPFLDSQIHIGNAVCVLDGLLFGPLNGFLAAGIGNFLYDIVNGYGIESLITMVSKGCIALLAGWIAGSLIRKDKLGKADEIRLVLGAVAGALCYVALYMLKTFLFGLYVNGLTMDGTLAKMAARLPASFINAAFASIAAPILYNGLHPALHRLLKKRR